MAKNIYLRDIRKARNLTMLELGKKVGLTESAIGMYETGKRKPNYEMLLKLSEALDCSVMDILHGLDNPIKYDLPWELPEGLQELRDVWLKLSQEDKAIIKIITDKYK